MWLLLALGSALFAGVTAVLAKAGLQDTDSHLATALRTGVVLVFSWLIVFLTGAQTQLFAIRGTAWASLVLSGVATGLSWLCYFRALQLGDVHKVAAVDKSSTVLTMLLAVLVLQEPLTWKKAIGMAAMADGVPSPYGCPGQKPETQLDAVGFRQRALCKPGGSFEQMGDAGDRFPFGNGCSHCCGSGDGLGTGFPAEAAKAGASNQCQKLGVSVFIRNSHRLVLAVLFSRAAAGTDERGGSR